MAIFTQINGSHTRPGVLDKDHVAALLAQDGDATPWQLVGEHATLAVDVFHVRLEWNDKGVWVPSIGACIPPGQQDASQRLSAPGTGTTVGAVLHLERKLGGDDDPVIVWSVD
ncbi:MAG TPA: hypothetical protein ENJ35_03670, partial [Gammaproteobacteria bacterium]|nr:hypothetical protein [Gammaproteobacteria bacterium]